MAETTTYSDDLKAIRKIMEGSSRFLSLSGLSGVFTGLVAIAGALVAWLFILSKSASLEWSMLSPGDARGGLWLIADAAIILVLAVSISFILSYSKSARLGIKFWTPVSRRMLFNLMIPLFAGLVFIIFLAVEKATLFIAPSMLIFYGLALVNAGKFTFGEIHYLGLLQILTGLVSLFFPSYGLLFWVAGFGFLHVFYGLLMYRRYEKPVE